LRQILADPWRTFADQHSLGGELDGKVHNITDFGLFVSPSDGIRGMVHVSDIAWNRAANDVLGKYHKGQPVRVKLLGVDVEKQRISLGIKQLQAKPGIS
jgi:small subunit ribosomal protein S1